MLFPRWSHDGQSTPLSEQAIVHFLHGENPCVLGPAEWSSPKKSMSDESKNIRCGPSMVRQDRGPPCIKFAGGKRG